MYMPSSSRTPLATPATSLLRTALSVFASPFRTSIWTKSDKYSFGGCTPAELDVIARIYALWAAKLNIAFPSPGVCKALAAAATTVIQHASADDPHRTADLIEQYLDRATALQDVGEATAICLLATWSEGRLAPMDWKVASGLRNLGIITEEEEKGLISKNHTRFARAYVNKVLPAWRVEVERRTPEQADAYWATHATKRSKTKPSIPIE